MLNKIRIFIAGSTELETEMDIFKNVANKMSVEYDQKKQETVFLAINCKDLNMFFQKNGQQELYNKYIQEQADIVFLVFDSVIGEKTLQEYILAYESYNAEKRPEIQVFIKVDHKDEIINSLKQCSKNLPEQYFDTYLNQDDLKSKIEKALRHYVDNLYAIERQRSSSSQVGNLSKEEAWGKLMIAQTFFEEQSNDKERRDEVVLLLKGLASYGINNWRFYYKIYQLLSDSYEKESIEVTLMALNRAKECTFAKGEEFFKSRVFKYAGVMNRRLGENLDDSISDVMRSYQIITTNPSIRGEMADVLYNLYVLYGIKGDWDNCHAIKKKMDVYLVPEDVEELVEKAMKKINEYNQ